MNNKERLFFVILTYLIFGAFFIRAYLTGSQWIIDATLTLLFVTFVFAIKKWLKLSRVGFSLFLFSLILHNMGSFGWYSWSYSWMGYDNIVHLISSFTLAYIAFNFLSRKLHVKNDKRVQKTVVDEHIVVFIFLVLSTVAFLGTTIELMEFSGFWFLGSGEGLLLAGEGDYGGVDAMAGQYIDTMTDIIVNTLGAILGTLFFYFYKYKKQPWLKYN